MTETKEIKIGSKVLMGEEKHEFIVIGIRNDSQVYCRSSNGRNESCFAIKDLEVLS